MWNKTTRVKCAENSITDLTIEVYYDRFSRLRRTNSTAPSKNPKVRSWRMCSQSSVEHGRFPRSTGEDLGLYFVSEWIKVGCEDNGCCSYNILGFLLDNGLITYVLNTLHANHYRKSNILRKNETDRVDVQTIAAMLLSDVGLKSDRDTAYHNNEMDNYFFWPDWILRADSEKESHIRHMRRTWLGLNFEVR